MHEFSIALSIVEISEEHARKENAGIIREIDVEVGELSGVILDALEFAMESAFKGTMLENAKYNLIPVQGKAKCLQCQHEFNTDNLITPCPECNSFRLEIIHGRELRVKSMIID